MWVAFPYSHWREASEARAAVRERSGAGKRSCAAARHTRGPVRRGAGRRRPVAAAEAGHGKVRAGGMRRRWPARVWAQPWPPSPAVRLQAESPGLLPAVPLLLLLLLLLGAASGRADAPDASTGAGSGAHARNTGVPSLEPVPGITRAWSYDASADTCARVAASELTAERYAAEFAAPMKPLIIEGLASSWPAAKWGDPSYLSAAPWGPTTPGNGVSSMGDGSERVHQCFWATKRIHEVEAELKMGEGGDDARLERASLYEAFKRMLVANCTARARAVLPLPSQQPFTDDYPDGTLGDMVQHTLGDPARNSEPWMPHSSYGQYLTLESDIFGHFPELWDDHVGPLPEYLRPEEFLRFEKDTVRGGRRGAPANRSLLLGGKGSRSALHQDGYGWTSWIAVLSGSKLAKVWPGSIDAAATFGGGAEEFDPFNEYPPEVDEAWARGGRFGAHGDGEFDDGWRSAAKPRAPMLPAECLIRAGDVLITHNFWHTVVNLEPTVAVTSNFVDEAAAAHYLWKTLSAKRVESEDLRDILERLLRSRNTGIADRVVEQFIGWAKARCGTHEQELVARAAANAQTYWLLISSIASAAPASKTHAVLALSAQLERVCEGGEGATAIAAAAAQDAAALEVAGRKGEKYAEPKDQSQHLLKGGGEDDVHEVTLKEQIELSRGAQMQQPKLHVPSIGEQKREHERERLRDAQQAMARAREDPQGVPANQQSHPVGQFLSGARADTVGSKAHSDREEAAYEGVTQKAHGTSGGAQAFTRVRPHVRASLDGSETLPLYVAPAAAAVLFVAVLLRGTIVRRRRAATRNMRLPHTAPRARGRA